MDYRQQAEEAFGELNKRQSCTSIDGVTAEDARMLRMYISRLASRKGWIVFTKRQNNQLVIWRVE